VGRLNKVIYVPLVISHSGLVPSESPIAIHYKLILMDASLERVQQGELIATHFLHEEALVPVSETTYQIGLLPAKVPRK
jgi:hypothetical protein